MAKSSRLIVAAKPDGFGVRLCTMLNAMYLAKKTNLTFKFRWELPERTTNIQREILSPYDNFPTKEMLFTPDFIAKYHTTQVPMSEDVYIIYNFKSLKEFKEAEPRYQFGFYSAHNLLCDCWSDIDRIEYFRILKECWDSIQWTPFAKNIINKAKQKAAQLSPFTAIHLRAGDVVYNIKAEPHTNPYAFLEKPFSPYLALDFINKERQSGNKVILFSDDLPTLKALKEQNDYIWQINGGEGQNL